MASLIGSHNRTNGIKQLPCRAVLSLNGAGLGGDETHPDTVTIVRDTRAFPDGEAPPDWRTYDGSDWPAFGEYWHAIHEAYWKLNHADFYQITNEQGGGEGPDVAGNYEQLVKVERAIMQAANADGRKCAVLNLAGGSPGDFEIWKAICAPFIVEAWETGGNLYARHCYADWFVEDDGSINNGQPQRVINELEYLKSIGYGGGMVLTECGLYGGYGVADYDYFEQQVTRWEQALRPYADMFIGLAWWECGASEFNADYTDHIKKLLPYIQAGNLPRWAPSTQQPPDGGGGSMDHTFETSRSATVNKVWHLNKTGRKATIYFQRSQGGCLTESLPSVEVMIPDGAAVHSLYVDVTGTQTVEVDCPDEPANPNPPPPILTLPAGSKGVDLSNYQAGFFDLVDPADFDFYIFRCSDGMNTSATSNNHDANGVDKSLWKFADVGHASMRPWGIYHFLRPGNVQGQVNKVLGILQALKERGTPPRTAVFDNGVKLPAVWIDVEDGALTSTQVQEFYNLVAAGHHTGIYTGKPIWESITAGASVWWADVPLWIAAYGVNDGNVPPWPDGPFLPRGYVEAVVWQYSSNPIDMNIVGPYPPTATQPPPPPPPPPVGQTVDMTQYYLPPNGRTYGDISIKPTNWGQGDVRQQLQLHGGYLFVTKGGEFEKRMILDGRIYFLMDDSPGDGKYYTVNSPTGWIPAQWAVGQTFTRQEATTFYHKANCQPTGEESNWTNVMLFKALYGEWVSPYGLKLVNVAHLQWLVNGVVEENYWLGKNLGYVGWSNKHGRESWIKEIIPYTDQEPNRFAGSCYHPAFG